ncbi:hypothetical protein LCGC14_0785940 [marine sediment metagenome]|uniref:DUF551 domain-containing protein n=1 Tax=marine sediment metagenome TaxID=412755 RepID=A0A0F9QDW7_9ZZZZ
MASEWIDVKEGLPKCTIVAWVYTREGRCYMAGFSPKQGFCHWSARWSDRTPIKDVGWWFRLAVPPRPSAWEPDNALPG